MAGRANQLFGFSLTAPPAEGRANQSKLLVMQVNAAATGQAGQSLLQVLYEPLIASEGRCDQVALQVMYDLPSDGLADQLNMFALVEPPTKALSSAVKLLVMYGLDELTPDAPIYTPMSDFLFPTLPGLGWSVHKKPKFQTLISPHISGREVRASNYAYPVWEFELKYDFLRAGTEAELQTLMGFYLARTGSFDTFLYADPSENNVVAGATLGTGDGALIKFNMFKTYGGFSEPCGYVDPATLAVYKDDVLQTQGSDYTFNSPNQIQFSTPPAIGEVVTANYTWYYRVRFGEDTQDYENFMFNLWSLKKVSLVSVKP